MYEPTIDPELLSKGATSIDAHFALMNPQLSQLRAAWGIARALGRVLVMPRFTCGMDRVWFPHDGVFPGSDPLFTVPFEPCPMDHVRPLQRMHAATRCAFSHASLSLLSPDLGHGGDGAQRHAGRHPRVVPAGVRTQQH